MKLNHTQANMVDSLAGRISQKSAPESFYTVNLVASWLFRIFTWMGHRYTNRITQMNGSCHICRLSHVTHVNESCHTHEWVMSCIWNESCHTYEWVMSHILCAVESPPLKWWPVWHTQTRVMSHVWMSESCDTYSVPMADSPVKITGLFCRIQSLL